MSKRCLLAMLPAALALLAEAAVLTGLLIPPVLLLRIDAVLILIVIGLLLSLAIATALVVNNRLRRVRQESARQVRSQVIQERNRFLRRLDHELKNPLTAIRAALANLASEPLSGPQQEIISSIQHQALRLSNLSADLRKLAELETRPLERYSIVIADLLNEIVAVAREQAAVETRQLTVVLPRAPWPVPNVAGDRDLLFLALHNLLDNALKFSRPGDTIELRAYEDGSTVVIEIADTGPGIPADESQNVWEELYRGEAAHGVPGSGLGLALVRAIVSRHAGHVALRSRPGQGTVVSIRLPLA